jgi:L-cysteate sulfo-lyase
MNPMELDRFPRLRFAHLPTPLEEANNLSRILGGPRLFIKRDDCTGLSTGGNKARKLEFLMADANRLSADLVITHGAVQSNHVRQTAAIAAKMGLACEILLEDRTGIETPEHLNSGNVLLDRLHGAKISRCPAGQDMDAAMGRAADLLRSQGRHPYVIPGGGSNAIGALGYVDCARELLDQTRDLGISIDCVVLATGSAGTQAGLLAGLESLNTKTSVLGISVRAPRAAQEAKVFSLAEATMELLGERQIGRNSVVANDDYVGPGYGVLTNNIIEAVRLVARSEGLLLDPVYTGKAMAGLIDLIRRGLFDKRDNVVFLHTGGTSGLFAYSQGFDEGGQTEAIELRAGGR